MGALAAVLAIAALLTAGGPVLGSAVSAAVATPTLISTASPPVTVGQQIFDNVNLVGGASPTGTVTFQLFGPDDAACATPIFSSTIPVAGTSINSAPFTTSAAGVYRFTVTYSGDANNNAAGPTPCSDPATAVIVDRARTVVSTVASPAGASIGDTATLAGGFNPTGTITFDLTGPGDQFCIGPIFFTSTVPVNGNGFYNSAPFTPTISGTYQWRASYSGDANNRGSGPTSCLDPAESVTVSVVPTVSITTTASPSVVVGGTVNDTATLTGGTSPTGTITFSLFGPNNATCTGTPAFTSTVSVAGAGGYDSASFLPTAPGIYRWVAAYSGDANNAAVSTNCGDPAESVNISAPPQVTLSTTASPSGVVVGTTIRDIASLTGGTNPTGTVTFNLFGPNNANCVGTPIFTSSVALTGATATSAAFVPTAAGTYRWVAAYSGDANNAPTMNACNDPDEIVFVSIIPTPTIITVASPSVAVGGEIHDSAVLAVNLISGAVVPTGTITFNLFGPDNATCTGTRVFTSTVAVVAGVAANSASFVPTAAGTYRWVATYSGDANNGPAGPTACGDPAETVTVTPPLPVLLTTQASPVVAGGSIHDSASLTGGTNPTGTITFNLFGPNDATCTGAPAFTSTVSVAGIGGYDSASFLPTASGTYRWVATYSGDANNGPAGPTACGDPAETVTVIPLTAPNITTTASPSVVVGGAIHDTAVVSGGNNPTGIMVFFLSGPDEPTCRSGAFVPQAVVINGNGTYESAPKTPTVPGTYRWRVEYGGDANNAPAFADCSDPGESVVVTAPPPPPPPSIRVDGEASPASLPEPGGTFTGGVSVTNTGTEPVTLSALADEDLNGVGTCAVPQVLAPEASYSCTFPIVFTGNAGDTKTVPVTATATDAMGRLVTSTDTFVLTLTDVVPTVTMAKVADPMSLAAPGGTFAYRVTVTNTSIEPVDVVGLADDVYGDLNGSGTCVVGTKLAANGGTYSCSFLGDFTGKVGESQTDTATARAVDDEANSVSASASATVILVPTPPTPVSPPSAPVGVAAPGPNVISPGARGPLSRTGADLARDGLLAAVALVVGSLLLLASSRSSLRFPTRLFLPVRKRRPRS